MKAVIALVALVLRVASSTSRGRGLQPDGLQAASPAPAAAAPGPALPSLEALHVSFEIKNFNYYDMTKVTCPKKVKVHKGKGKKGPKAKKAGKKGPLDPFGGLDDLTIRADDLEGPDVGKAIDEVHGHSENINKQVEEGLADSAEAIDEAEVKPPEVAIKPAEVKPPWPTKGEKKDPPKFNTQADKDAFYGKAAPKFKTKAEKDAYYGKGAKKENPPKFNSQAEKDAFYKKEPPKFNSQAEKNAYYGKSFLQVETGACAAMPDLTETKSTKCETVQDVLTRAIKETVNNVIQCLYLQSQQVVIGAPASAGAAPAAAADSGELVYSLPGLPAAPAGVSGLIPLPVQVAFLQTRISAPAPAPAPGAASPGEAGPILPEVKMFVTFSPGRELEGGRSTMVEIAFLDTPNNALNDVAMAIPMVEKALEAGILKKQLKKAIQSIIGFKPKLHAMGMEMKPIVQWEVDKCESHIKKLVGQFTLHYTRNQVPMALYNECTNFLTKMSFSHDYVLDPQDTVRCRKATAKFAKHWDYGANAENSDFADMCHQACEAKYGRDAPKCNVASDPGGNGNLLDQPLL